MKNHKTEGFNRTGLATSIITNPDMLDNTQIDFFTPGDPESAFLSEREFYIESTGAIGTVPPPATIKSLAEAAEALVQGKDSQVFMDKLGARLAFERSGTRLYEAFLQKLQVLGPKKRIPEIDTVNQFLHEELSHMELVKQAIVEVGGDPTAVTPSANIDGVASLGLIQVVTDPRTNIVQSLHAIHIAELADNDGWEMLIELARAVGRDKIASGFEKALAEEQRHLDEVRSWMKLLVLEETNINGNGKTKTKKTRRK
jgi:hypothetical protein